MVSLLEMLKRRSHHAPTEKGLFFNKVSCGLYVMKMEKHCYRWKSPRMQMQE